MITTSPLGRLFLLADLRDNVSAAAATARRHDQWPESSPTPPEMVNTQRTQMNSSGAQSQLSDRLGHTGLLISLKA